jgi:precorrin-6B methylase 2
MASSFTSDYAALVAKSTKDWPEGAEMEDLENTLRMLSRWRALVLANTFIKEQGAKIWSGPFAGMEYVTEATEGSLIARLLGTYESELHPHLSAIVAKGIDCVIDVGCAEGYYAVGMARLAPEITVYAYDIEEKARLACADLAARNGVADRVIVGGEFAPDGFEAFAGRRALVLVDAEGAEVDILQPDLSPALSGMTVIVETHDLYRRNALATLVARFAATHDIVRVDQAPKAFTPPPWFGWLAHLDQLLAVWEWRAKPTPWLVMTPRL